MATRLELRIAGCSHLKILDQSETSKALEIKSMQLFAFCLVSVSQMFIPACRELLRPSFELVRLISCQQIT